MAREIVKKLLHVTENRIICQKNLTINNGFNEEKTLFLSEWILNTLSKKGESDLWIKKNINSFYLLVFCSSVKWLKYKLDKTPMQKINAYAFKLVIQFHMTILEIHFTLYDFITQFVNVIMNRCWM